MGEPEAVITSLDGREIPLTHTHTLLHEDSAVIAGKTGTTQAARQCLLSIVKEGDREYVVVLLGSRERYGDMRGFLRALSTLFI
jgi:D-alanyl-D-alanine carboxypeptidase (penicillin-binding protein 5/6)